MEVVLLLQRQEVLGVHLLEARGDILAIELSTNFRESFHDIRRRLLSTRSFSNSRCYKCHLESIEETKLSLTALILIDPPILALGPPEHGGTFAGTLTVK